MFDLRTSNILKQVNLFVISCSEVITGFNENNNVLKCIISNFHKRSIFQGIQSQVERVSKRKD